MGENKISVELTVNEWNVVLAALTELPYKTSADIINTIHGQATPQYNAMQENNGNQSVSND